MGPEDSSAIDSDHLLLGSRSTTRNIPVAWSHLIRREDTETENAGPSLDMCLLLES